MIVSVIHCFHSLTLDILAHYIIETIILAEFQLTTRSRNDQGLDPCQPLLKPEARLIQSGQTLLCYFFCTLSFSEKSEKLAFWRVDKEKAYMDNHNSTKLQKRQLHQRTGQSSAQKRHQRHAENCRINYWESVMDASSKPFRAQPRETYTLC